MRGGVDSAAGELVLDGDERPGCAGAREIESEGRLVSTVGVGRAGGYGEVTGDT